MNSTEVLRVWGKGLQHRHYVISFTSFARSGDWHCLQAVPIALRWKSTGGFEGFFQSHLWLIYTWPSCCMILHSQTSLRRLRMLHSSTPGSAKLGAEDDLIPNNPRLRNQTKPVPAKQRWAMMAMPQTWNVNGEKWEDPRLMHCKTVGEMELLGSRPL